MSRVHETLCPEAYETSAATPWAFECVTTPKIERRGSKKVNMAQYAAIKTSKKSLTMRQYAFFLMQNYPNVNVGRQRLYAWFRKEGIIPDNSRIPNKKYIREGLFDVRYAVTSSPNCYEPVTMISPKGQQFFTLSILKAFGEKIA